MKLLKLTCLAIVLIALSPATILADKTIHATLRGFDEVPAVSTTGSGLFRAKINTDATEISYELSYENLEGTVTAASHIHVGQKGVNGGVSAFFVADPCRRVRRPLGR